MAILLTGVAGFIGFNLASQLLARGEEVIGVDDLNDYYDVTLKEARLEQLRQFTRFRFTKVDVSDRKQLDGFADATPGIDRVIHLAAQAGVRYSLESPAAYIQANVDGTLAVLELCRRNRGIKHLVYASSSSVYGVQDTLPFAVGQPTDRPTSLYAATKIAGEAMAAAYSHLFRIPATGLRFFTVYGPWGRPDMSVFVFTKAILSGKPIRVFNHGRMKRDFTYIDDIVAGIVAALDRPPEDDGATYAPHRVYNLGNRRSEPLMRLIGLIEEACGKPAVIDFDTMQAGDITETFADAEPAARELGFAPRTAIDEGIPKFVAWYRDYYHV
jgi:UDP-glucuronate 4-epimerase